MIPRFLINTSLILFLSIVCTNLFAQSSIVSKIEEAAKKIDGNTGVYALVMETGQAIAYNASKRFPMQSVYKFPIAMAMLDKIDKGQFTLDQKVHVDRTEYIPVRGHSPIRDQFSGGTDITIRDLIKYNVEESDGTACDVLLRLLGGTQKAKQFIQELGIKDITIATTEMLQMSIDTIQYQNWSTPEAMTRLLSIFYNGKYLSENSRILLLNNMAASGPGKNRLKGLLPTGTVVAHKTGTAATINGLTRATNDVGIISLPNGKHLAISVFISDSHADETAREKTIATISKIIFDYYSSAK